MKRKKVSILNKLFVLPSKTEEEIGSAGEQPASNKFYGYTLSMLRCGAIPHLIGALIVVSGMAKKNSNKVFQQKNLFFNTESLWHKLPFK